MKAWRYRAIGVVLLVGASMLIPAWGPYEMALWVVLLLAVLLVPIPKRWLPHQHVSYKG